MIIKNKYQSKTGIHTIKHPIFSQGTPEDIAKQLSEHLEAGADHVAVQVLGGSDNLLPTLEELAGPLGLKS
jgi:hypothetical protein